MIPNHFVANQQQLEELLDWFHNVPSEKRHSLVSELIGVMVPLKKGPMSPQPLLVMKAFDKESDSSESHAYTFDLDTAIMIGEAAKMAKQIIEKGEVPSQFSSKPMTQSQSNPNWN